MKRLMLVAIAVLCLVVTHQLKVERASADVDLGNPGPIAVCARSSDTLAWDAGGNCWQAVGTSWTRRGQWDLPIPVAELAMVSNGGIELLVVSADGRCWIERDIGLGWQLMDEFPNSPVSLEPDTWGSIKARHR